MRNIAAAMSLASRSGPVWRINYDQGTRQIHREPTRQRLRSRHADSTSVSADLGLDIMSNGQDNAELREARRGGGKCHITLTLQPISNVKGIGEILDRKFLAHNMRYRAAASLEINLRSYQTNSVEFGRHERRKGTCRPCCRPDSSSSLNFVCFLLPASRIEPTNARCDQARRTSCIPMQEEVGTAAHTHNQRNRCYDALKNHASRASNVVWRYRSERRQRNFVPEGLRMLGPCLVIHECKPTAQDPWKNIRMLRSRKPRVPTFDCAGVIADDRSSISFLTRSPSPLTEAPGSTHNKCTQDSFCKSGHMSVVRKTKRCGKLESWWSDEMSWRCGGA